MEFNTRNLIIRLMGGLMIGFSLKPDSTSFLCGMVGVLILENSVFIAAKIK